MTLNSIFNLLSHLKCKYCFLLDCWKALETPNASKRRTWFIWLFPFRTVNSFNFLFWISPWTCADPDVDKASPQDCTARSNDHSKKQKVSTFIWNQPALNNVKSCATWDKNAAGMTVSATIIKEFLFVKSYVEKFKCIRCTDMFRISSKLLSSIRIMKCPPTYIPQDDKKP